MVYLVGNGYVCNYISQIKIENKKYAGVCRSEKKNCDVNIKLDISVDNKKLKELIREKSIIVYLVPPQQNGCLDLVLKNFLLNVNKKYIQKIIYTSTSGVYGDKKDKVVNESESIEPITDRAKRRANAESQIESSGLKYTILRVPGIYGKDRLPMKRIKERLPLIKRDICKHTNLIHVKDLARLIVACFNNSASDMSTINVSDGTAIKTTDYYLHIYDLIGQPYPEFIDYKDASQLYDKKRQSFINESRILDTRLMREIFPNIIKFKDVREGIKDCLN
tara:strand:- start:67 stop:900 length:834 start_codon:yes stop_codon:yes gene_type:complete